MLVCDPGRTLYIRSGERQVELFSTVSSLSRAHIRRWLWQYPDAEDQFGNPVPSFSSEYPIQPVTPHIHTREVLDDLCHSTYWSYHRRAATADISGGTVFVDVIHLALHLVGLEQDWSLGGPLGWTEDRSLTGDVLQRFCPLDRRERLVILGHLTPFGIIDLWYRRTMEEAQTFDVVPPIYIHFALALGCVRAVIGKYEGIPTLPAHETVEEVMRLPAIDAPYVAPLHAIHEWADTPELHPIFSKICPHC